MGVSATATPALLSPSNTPQTIHTNWRNSRGPIVLAQDVTTQKDQPQIVLAVKDETEDASEWIEPADVRSLRRHEHLEHLLDKVPVYRIKGDREIILVPYYVAGTFDGGVRTMFPVSSR